MFLLMLFRRSNITLDTKEMGRNTTKKTHPPQFSYINKNIEEVSFYVITSSNANSIK
jgi:hypothetical protein